MTLRGHTAPVTRVAIAPNCCEVVTISEDGSAQVLVARTRQSVWY